MFKFVSFLVVFYSNAWCKVLSSNSDLTDDETLLDEELSGDYDGAEGSGQPMPENETEESNLTLYLGVAIGAVALVLVGGIIFCVHRMQKKNEGDYKTDYKSGHRA